MKDAATALSKWATATRELSNLKVGDPMEHIAQAGQAGQAIGAAKADRKEACRLVNQRQ